MVAIQSDIAKRHCLQTQQKSFKHWAFLTPLVGINLYSYNFSFQCDYHRKS